MALNPGFALNYLIRRPGFVDAERGCNQLIKAAHVLTSLNLHPTQAIYPNQL